MLETVIGLAIGGLSFAALATVLGTGISSNRFQFEQLLTTDSGRFLFEKIVSDIRLAQDGPSGEEWLVQAGEYSIVFYANVDEDVEVEQVRYWLADHDLTREVLNPGETAGERIVFKDVYNVAPSYPLFSYYGQQAKYIPIGEVTSDAVVSVFVWLVIDVDPTQQPGPVALQTLVTPRLIRSSAAGGGGSASTARLKPVTLDYPMDHNSTTNMEVEVYLIESSPPAIQTWPIATVNSRLTTYSGEKVNINYQEQTMGSNPPGWYVWVGPILVGQSGDQKYYVTQQWPIADVCLGNTLSNLLATCPKKTATHASGAFSKQYQLVLLYEGGDYQDYVNDITFTYVPPGAAPTPAPQPVPALASMGLEEGNSNVVGDSSGNGITGELKQGLSSGWSTDRPTAISGNQFSLQFDGNNDHILLADNASLNFSSDFTFSTWIKTSGTGDYVLLGSSDGASGYEVRLSNGLLSAGWNGVMHTAGISANSGQWRHVAVTFNAATLGVAIYLDGVNIASGGGGGSAPISYSGERRIGSTSGGDDFYSGFMDDIRFYTGRLTDAQIGQLAAGGNPTQ